MAKVILTDNGLIVRDEHNKHIVKVFVSTAQSVALFASGLGERNRFGLVAFANTDGKNLMRRVSAVLHVLRIVQILQNALAEGDAVLVDVNIRRYVGSEVEHLKVNIGELSNQVQSY